MSNQKTMRDTLIKRVCEQMHSDDSIFFLSADMGAPSLDSIRTDFKERFINVGIAEQNLVTVASGLAMEGYTVYALAIAAFFLRAYEQIRNNMALMAPIKPLNINLLGVGSGVSYDMAGPSHHCLEDISIMRTLPNLHVVSPSDWVMAQNLPDWIARTQQPKYIRMDSKPLPALYNAADPLKLDSGFHEWRKGEELCLVATGHMTHQALKLAEAMTDRNVGVLDLFFLKDLDRKALFATLSKYQRVVTMEEGFIDKGGLDNLIINLLRENRATIQSMHFGFKDTYFFKFGSRDYLYSLNECTNDDIRRTIESNA